MNTPKSQLGEDTVAWGLEHKGHFSVKSAYLLLKDINIGGECMIWRWIWAWEGHAHLIGWRPAGDGWFTLNSDGSLYSNPNKAASGGLLRNDNCRFVYAFTANLGICSIMRAELKGTIEGMKLAWDKGMRKLRVQSDSKVVVDMISSAAAGYNTHAALLLQFTELCSREWQVSIHHIYREANFAVDYPANLGHSFDLGI
ncbi:Putative ribonuclease H protein At1g65750 [Linum perenne]